MVDLRLEDKARYLLGEQFPELFNDGNIEPSSIAAFVGSWPQYRKGYLDLVPSQKEKVERLDILAYAMVFLETNFGKQPNYGLEQAIQDVAKEAVYQGQHIMFLQHLSYLGILYKRTYDKSPRMVLSDTLAYHLNRRYASAVSYVNRKMHRGKERILQRLQQGQRVFGFNTDVIPTWLLAPKRET